MQLIYDPVYYSMEEQKDSEYLFLILDNPVHMNTIFSSGSGMHS